MPAKKKPTYVVATQTTITSLDGMRYVVNKGDMYDKTHPIVKKLGGFVPLEDYLARSGRIVETATAAPGETRDVAAPKKK